MDRREFIKLLPTGAVGSMILKSALGSTLLSGCSDDDTQSAPIQQQAKKNADGNYNIILILNDQEKYIHTFPKGTTFKGRERLRKMGMTFDNHYACSNVSTASRSTIYTGLHITETKMMDNTNFAFQPEMDRNLPTVGDMLRQVGYYTAYKGKWHLSKDDLTSLEDYGFSDWGTTGDRHGEYHQGYEEDPNIANESCDWLRKIGLQKNAQGQSFFLAVNFINPHDIMYFNSTGSPSLTLTGGAPNSSVYAKTYPDVPIPNTWNEPIDALGRVAAHKEYYDTWNKATGHAPQTKEDWEKFQDYYLNCIQDNDNQLVTLLDFLEDHQLLSNTIILFSADHGEMMGAHGLKGKAGFMYDDNIHVPMIICHPEYPGGRRCHSLTSHLDMTPTILDMTFTENKQTIAPNLKGGSLLPLLQNPEAVHRNETGALFAFDMLSMIDGDSAVDPYSTENKFNLTKRGFLRGIITEEYKFARYFSPLHFNKPESFDALYADNDVELFAKDSDETDNLAYLDNKKDVDACKNLVMTYNTRLNQLIEQEIGEDNGQETEAFVGGLERYGI